MPAELVIRGGTVFDGTRRARPGRRRGDRGRRDPRDRAEPARRARARRVGLRRHAGLHRHPHPLRRAGVLGPGAEAVVVPRRHHRGRRQLRLRDRADPPRAPRRDRAHARERRGHGRRRRSTAGIPWDFETFPEYLESVRRRGTVLNFTAYVGHSAAAALRDGRRGLRARRDRRTRSSACATLVREAIDAGAAGFSTSFSYAHRGVDGKPVPSRFAERDEVEALFRRGGPSAGKGVVLITPGRAVQLRRRLRVAAARRAAVHLPAVRRPGREAPRAGRAARAGRRSGAQVWPQVTPRPLTMQFTLADPYSLNTGKVFGELLQGDRDGAHRRVPRPGVAGAGGGRPRAVADEAALGDLRGLRVAALPRAAGPARRPSSRASAGCSPLDVMCELALAEDLATRFRAYIANDDVDAVGHLLTHEQRGAGALRRRRARRPAVRRAAAHRPARHAGCASASVMPLEQAVRKLTGEPADLFGFVRPRLPARGLLGRRVRVRSARPSAPARPGGCATSRPTPNA